MQMTQAMANATCTEMLKVWGGRYPTWSEFKTAHDAGRVQCDKTIAVLSIRSPAYPAMWRFIYCGIVFAISRLIVPAALAAWLLGFIGGWWAVASIPAAMLLKAVCREGVVYGMIEGARNNEAFYNQLVTNGAFRFAPSGDGVAT